MMHSFAGRFTAGRGDKSSPNFYYIYQSARNASSGLIINISLFPSNMSVLENGMGVVAHD
ncbi:hypothetical protein COK64_22720 [Bacillus thuringiensis]|nr:hypothetical protein COK64_22720 [Bacillus thuringiensis]